MEDWIPACAGMTAWLIPPLAKPITEACRYLKLWWDKEALHKLAEERNPLEFKDLVIVGGNEAHQRMVEDLSRTGRPAAAGSWMCSCGRIVKSLPR